MKKELACPLCGGRVIETAKGFACENWPGMKGACRFTVWKESYGAVFDEEDVERLVAGESVRKVNTSKGGSKYEAVWMLSGDGKKPVFVRAEDADGDLGLDGDLKSTGEEKAKLEGNRSEEEL